MEYNFFRQVEDCRTGKKRPARNDMRGGCHCEGGCLFPTEAIFNLDCAGSYMKKSRQNEESPRHGLAYWREQQSEIGINCYLEYIPIATPLRRGSNYRYRFIIQNGIIAGIVIATGHLMTELIQTGNAARS